MLSGQAHLPEGRITWEGRGQPFGPTPAYVMDIMTFDSLDMGLWVDGWHSILNGTVQAQGTGADDHAVSLTLSASTVNAQPVDSGRVELRLHDGRLGGQASVYADSGGFDIRFAGVVTDSAYAITSGTFQNVNVGPGWVWTDCRRSSVALSIRQASPELVRSCLIWCCVSSWIHREFQTSPLIWRASLWKRTVATTPRMPT